MKQVMIQIGRYGREKGWKVRAPRGAFLFKNTSFHDSRGVFVYVKFCDSGGVFIDRLV
jgi:hypothetical protein